MDTIHRDRPVLCDAGDLVWRGQRQSHDHPAEHRTILQFEPRVHLMKRFFSVLLVAMLLVVVLRVYFTRIRNAPSRKERSSVQQAANLVQEPQTEIQPAKAPANSPSAPIAPNATPQSISSQ